MARTDGWISPEKTRPSVPLEERIRFRAALNYSKSGSLQPHPKARTIPRPRSPN